VVEVTIAGIGTLRNVFGASDHDRHR
jgi:hypothetical protein